ncbi:hypothetical protein C8A00DRAFT_44180 [Chaetomidium leptoderma]|uniref:Uncharacterized protein n=1 Tax=Chaetomidium leptoderma TaxID=669021 RepID=A0AAN6VJS2_9PEZI|nr:hypothetical protein C8A00DRAFT_44180 [Chaetomidium leptoderma]
MQHTLNSSIFEGKLETLGDERRREKRLRVRNDTLGLGSFREARRRSATPARLVKPFIAFKPFLSLSLASTCKSLASIWRAHAAAVLYPLLEAKTAGFNQALLAVRATSLVCHAFQANTLPPRPVSLHALGVHVRKPDIDELKQVRDLQHLARCVEHMYFRGYHRDQMHFSEDYDGLSDEERNRMGSRFHRAMYRVLFAGAALTRAYLEPLILAPVQGPPGLLDRLINLGWDETQDVGRPAQKDIEYLERFPVYDIEGGQEKWEPAFGDLASWLLDDIETTFTKVEPPSLYPPMGTRMGAEELGRLQEVNFFLAAYGHMMDKLFNEFLSHPDRDHGSESGRMPPPFSGRVRKVSVAMLGIFRPEEVSMPERVEDSSSCYLINEPLVLKEQGTPTSQDRQVLDCVSPWTADVRWVLEIVHRLSGRPNLRNGFPSPPPPLRFIEFVLAEFFKARFKDGLFDEGSVRHLQDYQYGFLQNHHLLRIMVATWLFAKDKASSLGYYRFHW